MTNCHALKMKVADGKMRLTDLADMEQMLRVIHNESENVTYYKNWGYREIKTIKIDPTHAKIFARVFANMYICGRFK